jgi:hypothetical protein
MSGFEISDAHAARSAEKINTTNGRIRMGWEDGLVKWALSKLNGAVRRKKGQFRKYSPSAKETLRAAQQTAVRDV